MKRTTFFLLLCSLIAFTACESNTVEPSDEDVREPFLGNYHFVAQDGYNAAGGTAPSYTNTAEWDGTITRGEDINVLVFTYDDGTIKNFTVDAEGNLTSDNGRESGTIEPWGDYFFKATNYSPAGYYYNSLAGIRQ